MTTGVLLALIALAFTGPPLAYVFAKMVRLGWLKGGEKYREERKRKQLKLFKPEEREG